MNRRRASGRLPTPRPGDPLAPGALDRPRCCPLVSNSSNCAASGCPEQRSKIDDLDSQSKSQQTLAIVGFVGGGLGLAAGTTLFILSNGDSKSSGSAPKPQVALGIGPGSVLVNGTF